MIKEKVSINEKKTGLSITNGKISAVLKSNVQKTGIRLYDNDCLGIAGAIGAYDENDLTNNAKQMLKFKLPYSGKPTENLKREADFSKKLTITSEEFVEFSEKMLDTLGKNYPQFLFNHKFNLIEESVSLENDMGTSLAQTDRYAEFVLMLKHKESKSMADGFGAVIGREFDLDTVVNEVSKTCEAYEEKVDFGTENEKIPVILYGGHSAFISKFLSDLEGDTFGSGASLFSGKVGEKLFNDDFSLIVNRDTENTFRGFFDGEGTVLQNDRFDLIQNGVLKSPFTTKRIANQYGFGLTGSAALGYDATPSVTPDGIEVARSDKTLKELLGGRKAIYVIMAAGGDFTPQGEYASPIQSAYLYDGERFLGRLPQLAMSSNINDMFGEDFIGATSDGSYPGCPWSELIVNMDVRKIDTWL